MHYVIRDVFSPCGDRQRLLVRESPIRTARLSLAIHGRGGKIIGIKFRDKFPEEFPGFQLDPPLSEILWLTEPRPESLEAGKPSDDIVLRVSAEFRRRRTQVVRRAVYAAAIAALVVLAVTATVFGLLERVQAGRAETRRGDAVRAQGEAETRRLEAVKAQVRQRRPKLGPRTRKRRRSSNWIALSNLMTSQMLRAGTFYQSDPAYARELLNDCSACPIDRHDFAWRLFDGMCQRQRRTFVLPRYRVSCLAFSPDDQTLAIGMLSYDSATRLPKDGTVLLLDLSGQKRNRFLQYLQGDRFLCRL